ncbi:hypothetical protein AB0K18_06170 [Nonomuraea sp. NPDC049421]|uniref:hypothetical protein n=1 Tax=Nonomuraea sp. NPDC049421 TaxID=3155275 RepID=UPI00342A6D5B
MTSPHDPPDGVPRTPPDAQPRAGDQLLSIIGFACAAMALLFIPILFGLAGVVLGIVGHTRGEPLGRWAATAAGAAMLIGTLLGILMTTT